MKALATGKVQTFGGKTVVKDAQEAIDAASSAAQAAGKQLAYNVTATGKWVGVFTYVYGPMEVLQLLPQEGRIELLGNRRYPTVKPSKDSKLTVEIVIKDREGEAL